MPERTATTEASSTLPAALVFDWGQRHIGLALVPAVTHIPMPLTTLEAKRGWLDFNELDGYVRDYKPDQLVVGLPLNMDGSPSNETRRAKRFGASLKRHYKIPVAFVDERLTTREAVERAQVPTPDHSLAALVIAESWLASQS
ncbi:MAG: Holliday junction resolvase RuvX [Gammaproteobacteria bacterium]|nr:Holliday junction resolvase RuvX [Gammaproteobacteria bacterium]